MFSGSGPQLPGKQGGWIQFAAAAVQIGTAIKGFMDGSSAAGKQKAASEASARAREETGAEEMRRTIREQKQSLGLNEAKIGASGVQNTGSLSDIQAANRAEFNRQRDWIRKSTKSEAEAIRLGGSIQSGATRSGSLSGGISGVIGGLQTGGWLKG